MANRGAFANCEDVGPDVGRGVLESGASCSTCVDSLDGVVVVWLMGRLFIRNRRGDGVWGVVSQAIQIYYGHVRTEAGGAIFLD
jgi:hypothetical protein